MNQVIRECEEREDGEAVISETYRLDAEPEKVWRAVSEEHFRDAWLPDQLVLEILDQDPPREIEFLMEEREAPFVRSVVRFGLHPAPGGGTFLSIRHRRHVAMAARNDNAPLKMAA